MRERLIAYLLSDLDPADRSALEAELAADPQLRQELEKVRQCLGACDESCDADANVEVPPPQLASRTCCFVDHAIQKSKALCHHGGAANSLKYLSENHDPVVRRPRWSVYDVGAGLCVAAAVCALVFPSLQGARQIARGNKCQYNLSGIGAAMMEAVMRHNEQLPAIGPDQNAGVWVIWLKEKSGNEKELVDLLICPESERALRVSNGCLTMSIPTLQEYLAAKGAQRKFMRDNMAGDYAYSMGYRDEQGELHQVKFSGSRYLPLFADAPSPAIAGYQSANHGGCGQNVLYQDLSVKHCRQCKCQKNRDHLYLNDEGRPEAGCHEADIVLGPSGAMPILDLITAK
jgi:hypothetical protein